MAQVQRPRKRANCAEAVRIVRAAKLIRRMHGGAQADLVGTDCGGSYVVKWAQNPQHRRVLVNEVLGGWLMRRLGIATPEWAIVTADELFLKEHPNVEIVLSGHTIPVRPGLHFASRTPVDPERNAIFDFIPIGLIDRIVNADDFMAALVFDHWVDNTDKRQAVFIRRGPLYWAECIDNGHAFGFDGQCWQMRDRPHAATYPLPAEWYLRADFAPRLSAAITAAQGLTFSDFSEVIETIPVAWLQSDRKQLEKVAYELLRRGERLPDLLDAAIAHIRGAARPPGSVQKAQTPSRVSGLHRRLLSGHKD